MFKALKIMDIAWSIRFWDEAATRHFLSIQQGLLIMQEKLHEKQLFALCVSELQGVIELRIIHIGAS